jgi:DNA polymerase-3 subunit gamma/tau
MCNKCDVEYRASKNQRLLVELTLLKMTTIGQFVSEKKNNNIQIIAPAKKVEVKIKQEIVEEVPVKEVLHKTVDQVEKVEVVVEEKVEVKTVVKEEPLRKVRKSRFSLSDVMDDKKEVETELNAPKKSENFTESRMREVWMLFAEKINKEGKMNLFITLTSSDPTLEE